MRYMRRSVREAFGMEAAPDAGQPLGWRQPFSPPMSRPTYACVTDVLDVQAAAERE